GVGLALEDRADREAQRRQCEGERRNRPRGVGGAGHKAPARNRLALECARYVAVEGVLGGVLVVLAGQGHLRIPPERRRWSSSDGAYRYKYCGFGTHSRSQPDPPTPGSRQR